MPAPDVTTFLEVEFQQLRKNLALPHVQQLVPPLHRAYNLTWDAVPENRRLSIGKFLLLCHRAFLVSVSLIARGHPDDAAGTTRRAIEIARTAFAISYKKSNLDRWLAADTRRARWQARTAPPPKAPERKKKPPRLEVRFELPASHKVLENLTEMLGIESDAAVHFTPEYLGNYDFDIREAEGMAFFSYFVTERAHIERSLRFCASTHHSILFLFNDTLKGKPSASREWCEAMDTAREAALKLLRTPPETSA